MSGNDDKAVGDNVGNENDGANTRRVEQGLFASSSFSGLEMNEQTSEDYSAQMTAPTSDTDAANVGHATDDEEERYRKKIEEMKNGTGTPTTQMNRKISNPPLPHHPSLRPVTTGGTTSTNAISSSSDGVDSNSISSAPADVGRTASNSTSSVDEKVRKSSPMSLRPGAVASKPGTLSVARPPPAYGKLFGSASSTASDGSGGGHSAPSSGLGMAQGDSGECKTEETDGTLDDDEDRKPTFAEVRAQDAPLTLLEIDDGGAVDGPGGGKIDDPDAAIKADATPPSILSKPGAFAVAHTPGSPSGISKHSSGVGGLSLAAVSEDYDNSAENAGDSLTLSQIKEINRPPASAVASIPGAMNVRAGAVAPKSMVDNADYDGSDFIVDVNNSHMSLKQSFSSEAGMPTARPLNAEAVAPFEAYSVDDISTITGGSGDQPMTATERDLARRLQKLEEERNKVVQAQEVIIETEPLDGGGSEGAGGTTGSNSTPGITNVSGKGSDTRKIFGLPQSYAIAGCIFVSVIVIAVAVVVVVVVSVGKGGSNGGGIDSSTFGGSAGDFARFQQFQNVLRNMSDTGKMTDPSSPEFLALKWLTTGDPQKLSPNNMTQRNDVIERFSLAVFYYSTGGSDGAEDAAIDESESPRKAWKDSTGWLTGESVCDWKGVSCTEVETEDRVFGLELASNNLMGKLPMELAALTHMAFISLGTNAVSGTIPSEIGELTGLKQMDLFNNMMVGTIPIEILTKTTNLELFSLEKNSFSGPIGSEIGNLKALQRLYLSENAFNGTIPSELGSILDLIDLFLDKNLCTGSIPTELGNLQNIVSLRLNENKFTGSIPTILGQLLDLRELTLFNNNFNSTIPTELGSLQRLVKLQLSSNSLSGPIPSELGALPVLIALELFDNNLNSTIPTEFAQLQALETLYLDQNALTGQIPPGLGDILELKVLSLYNNALQGEVPAELGQLGFLSILFLNGNELSGNLNEVFCDFNSNYDTIRGDYIFLKQLEADCAGNEPKVRCDCCHRCY